MAPGVDASKVAFRVAISPLFVSPLSQSHALLVTDGYVSDATMASAPPDSVIGLYFFSSEKGTWKLLKSNPTAIVVSGYPHDGKLQNWAGHGRVLSFRVNWNYQGASRDQVYLFRLQLDRVVPLIQTFIAEDNNGVGVGATDANGNDATCDDLLNPKFTLRTGESLLDQDCEEDDGSWRFAGDSVQFEFHGTIRPVSSAGRPLPLRIWHSTAVLRLQKDGSLKLVSGKLPIYNGP